MPKITGPFWVYKRPKTKKFQVTLYPVSGLPQELAVFREPKTKAAAETGAMALIEYLKAQIRPPEDVQAPRVNEPPDRITVGAWLERFISLEDNPRANRLTGKNGSYSPGTIAMYKADIQAAQQRRSIYQWPT
ncbi:MAG: hypothetical protein LBP71_00025 [Spirochaetaceae bacterium]|jgi:hypothetical protein|nr:hypothetical protein [Spirochaetaceae bacterium]